MIRDDPRMTFALGDLNEAIADAIPDHEAIVSPTRRLTWRELQLRSRRLANLLAGAGLGCHRERDELQPWESGQDHVALYLYNGPEYLEGMLGAYKARVAPFNVNYRYVEDELRYLLTDASTRGDHLPRQLRAAPGARAAEAAAAGAAAPGRRRQRRAAAAGRARLRAALAAASDAPPRGSPERGRSLHPLHRRHDRHAEGRALAPARHLLRRHGRPLPGACSRCRASPRWSSARATARSSACCRAAVHARRRPVDRRSSSCTRAARSSCRSNPRALDPDDIWRTVERERVGTLSIVGDAFARPLLDQLRDAHYDLSCLHVLGSGGAILSPPFKQAFLELAARHHDLRRLRLVGDRRAGRDLTTKGEAIAPAFRMDDDTCVLDAALTRRLARGEERDRLAGAHRPPAARLLQRRGQDAAHLSDHRRRALRGARRPRPGRRRRHDPGLRPRLGVHQLRRREDLRRGGRAGAQAPPGGLRRRRRRHAERTLGRAGHRRRRAAPGTQASDDELRATAAEHLARYKLPKAFVFVDADRALGERQARLSLGEGDGDGQARR